MGELDGMWMVSQKNYKKTVEFVLCRISTVLVRTKFIHMYKMLNINCIISVIPHGFNAPTFACKTNIALFLYSNNEAAERN